jgi:hypothetical protein
MEQQRIHIIGMPFHSESLKLTTPTVIQNGNSHFTRILFDDAPLYFQTPRCETKQGVVTTAATKKAYYDIILDSNSETSHSPREFTAFVDWIQGLEDAAVKLLFSNGKLWFRDPLSEDDIRALFTSPLKPLKGGKQLALRVNLTTSITRSSQYTCTVFDEAEKLVHLSYVTPEHQLISIIEVLGIRFTSSSFQLDVAAKQIAVVANQPLFQTCIIKKDVMPPPPVVSQPVSQPQPELSVGGLLRPVSDNELINPTNLAVNDAISIHDPLKVYYTLYKAALKRAQAAKRESIQAFLDAKRIKNKYNLDIYEHECDNDDGDESDDSVTGADSRLDSEGPVTNTNNSDSGSDNDSDPDTGSASKSESDADSDSDSDSDSDLKSVAGSKPPLTIADGPNVSLSVDELK